MGEACREQLFRKKLASSETKGEKDG